MSQVTAGVGSWVGTKSSHGGGFPMLKLNCGAVRCNHCSSLWQASMRKLANLPLTASLAGMSFSLKR